MDKCPAQHTELAALDLLERALMVSSDQREAYISAYYDAPPPVRERALELLQSDRDGMAGLQTGGAGASLYEGDHDPPDIAGYRVISLLGRGGMGAVWLAQRRADDFTHQVAIKVIRPGVLSESLIERFRRERQILAQLNHPNIARLYDGGETLENQPYIVMEYIAGRTLRQWLAEEPEASAQQRIALFRQVALAVGFAHQNLVVHRDLTPGNVLVDDHGQAKLIDFGIARPPRVGEDSSPASAITGLSLTPGFAAPERAAGEASNTLSDIFSLGRILETMAGDGAEPEVRAIARRAAAHDPAARYPGVGELIEDLDRFATNRAIDTYSVSRRYRFAKFAKRERLLVASIAALFIALVAGVGASSWSYLRAERARTQAEQRFDEVRAMANFMLVDLDTRLQRTAGNTQARIALVKEAQRYLSALAATDDANPALRLEAAEGFTRLAQVQGSPVTPNLGMVDDARSNLAQADRLLDTMPAQTTRVRIARARNDLHRAMIALHADSDQDKAAQLISHAWGSLDAVASSQSTTKWRLTRAEIRLGQSELLTLAGEFGKLERLADAMQSDVSAWPDPERHSRAAEFERANADAVRGRALLFLGHSQEAARYSHRDRPLCFAGQADAQRSGDPKCPRLERLCRIRGRGRHRSAGVRAHAGSGARDSRSPRVAGERGQVAGKLRRQCPPGAGRSAQHPRAICRGSGPPARYRRAPGRDR